MQDEGPVLRELGQVVVDAVERHVDRALHMLTVVLALLADIEDQRLARSAPGELVRGDARPRVLSLIHI